MRQEFSTTSSDDRAVRLMNEREATKYLVEKGVRARGTTLRTLRQRTQGPAYFLISGRPHYGSQQLDAFVASCLVDPGRGPHRPHATAPPKAQREERGT